MRLAAAMFLLFVPALWPPAALGQSILDKDGDVLVTGEGGGTITFDAEGKAMDGVGAGVTIEVPKVCVPLDAVEIAKFCAWHGHGNSP